VSSYKRHDNKSLLLSGKLGADTVDYGGLRPTSAASSSRQIFSRVGRSSRTRVHMTGAAMLS